MSPDHRKRKQHKYSILDRAEDKSGDEPDPIEFDGGDVNLPEEAQGIDDDKEERWFVIRKSNK